MEATMKNCTVLFCCAALIYAFSLQIGNGIDRNAVERTAVVIWIITLVVACAELVIYLYMKEEHGDDADNPD